MKYCFYCTNASIYGGTIGSINEPPEPAEADCLHPLADQDDNMVLGYLDCGECPFFDPIIVECECGTSIELYKSYETCMGGSTCSQKCCDKIDLEDLGIKNFKEMKKYV